MAAVVRPDEHHLSDIDQLTFGGDNTAARWSWAGKDIALESRRGPQRCPYVERVDPLASAHTLTDVTTGGEPAFGAEDGDIVLARPPKCAPTPSALRGRYLDPDLDLYRVKAGGGAATRLTDTPGYDAEPTVCSKDGSILFTSMRDGDLDLYRMSADGSGMRRVTAMPGYDGEASFDADCSHIVWLATRPRGRVLDAYKAQLDAKDFHPPSTDVWVANADGTDARQVTYLDAVLHGPVWVPGHGRIVFATGNGSDNPRDMDLWAVDDNGAGLERLTTAPGYDGNPSFSQDGKWLAFTSARATLLGRPDLNVFIAKWGGAARFVEERPAEHLLGDSAWLADPARQGRGLGSKGLEDSGAYIERTFQSLGLQPAGGDQDFRQEFDAPTKATAQVSLSLGGPPLEASRVQALGFSSSGTADGPLVWVGSNEDFEKLDGKGKIAVVRRSGRWSLRHTAWLAKDRGAAGLIVVNDGAMPEMKAEPSEGIPAALVSADLFKPVLASLAKGVHPPGHLVVNLTTDGTPTFNVVAKWPAGAPAEQRLPGVVVVGAHYDHIGEASPGADDNASGTAALLQVARALSGSKATLRRDVVLVAFSGEDEGAAGADTFVQHPPPGMTAKDVVAMINLDMVGRLRDNTVQVFGEDSATQWQDLVAGACDTARLECKRATAGGFGGTDHTPFYEAGVPVVHLYTGVHGDYGKPTDTVDKLNAAGMAQIARAAEQLARDVADLGTRLEYHRLATAIDGDQPEFKVSLGTIPDKAGPPGGQKGMLLAGVRPGGAAEKAGLRKGDIVVRLGGRAIGAVEDVMFFIADAKPGDKVPVTVLRDGKEVTVELELQAVK